jgi:Protein of unknown function (DUF1501)
MAGKSDRPNAGLLRDLKGCGLLDSTLVVWSGEFGRCPSPKLDCRRIGAPRIEESPEDEVSKLYDTYQEENQFGSLPQHRN